MSSSSSRSPSTVTMASAGSLPHGTSEMLAARAEVLQRDSTAANCKMDLNLSPMCPSSLSPNWLRSSPQRHQDDEQRLVQHYCPSPFSRVDDKAHGSTPTKCSEGPLLGPGTGLTPRRINLLARTRRTPTTERDIKMRRTATSRLHRSSHRASVP